MSKIICSSVDIKEHYQYLTKKIKGFPAIIKYITSDNSDITIKGISDSDYNINIFIEKDNKDYFVGIDVLNNKIYLNTPKEDYNLVFNNIPSKKATPVGYSCSFDGKTINESILFELDQMTNVRHFEVFIGNDKYVIVVKSDKPFDESILFNSIFDNPIRNIIDLYHLIMYFIDTSELTISLADSFNSTIIIHNGKMTKYEVYLSIDNYVKKLGEKNGKEKR